MKSDIKNLKWLCQIKDDDGIGGKCTCVQPIDMNKDLLNCCVILFGFRRGKTENFNYQVRAIFNFLINLLNTRDSKIIVTFIVDHGWRYSPGKSSVVFG